MRVSSSAPLMSNSPVQDNVHARAVGVNYSYLKYSIQNDLSQLHLFANIYSN